MSGATVLSAWARLSRRERIMLILAAVATAVFAAWLSISALHDWRDGAADRARRAATDHLAVLAAAAQVEQARVRAGDETLEAALRRLAEARGLVLATLSEGEDGAMTATVEAGSGAAVMAWLAEAEARGGRVRAFAAVSNPDGTVQVQATISR